MRKLVDNAGHERRRAERVQLTVVGLSLDGSWCGRARIQDISLGGARIEDSGPAPALGTRLLLGFVLSSGESGADLDRFELPAAVARHTQSGGFGVAFEQADARLGPVLDGLLRRARTLRDKQIRTECALAALIP